jgi:hypothetical protein
VLSRKDRHESELSRIANAVATASLIENWIDG